MSDHDELIGRNLARLRMNSSPAEEVGGAREWSQTELANRMRELGHKWTQPTVVAVEKGERPLRMSEAIDAARILGVDLYDLVKYPAALDFYHVQVLTERALDQILVWSLTYERRLKALARAAADYEKEVGESLEDEMALMEVDLNAKPDHLVNARAAIDRFVSYVEAPEQWNPEDPVTRLMREHAPVVFEATENGERQAEA
ncbi:helix-turn-helix domain-containing protein [uncultured Microbacterium sp.]|uniref:helix-turn-helix domain-containing protein n=1 Tax=uncultured Microbacterium sp. TaxID=191216 RepID=UPI0025E54BEB|nr:helix-turn-helix transcriptional regulator [uncultured Microbacterium sp.]